jgi:hypothetical protein
MKTKTLFLTLFAGAFLCFSNLSYAQYHTAGSSSGSSSGGSGDGAWSQGQNVINVGIGFGSTLGSVYGSGYTGSVSPAFEASFEHALSDHWGIGLNIGYQSATATTTGTGYYYTFPYNSYSYTDEYKFSLLQFVARGAYHFTAGAKFDPYVGLMLGYCTISSSYSTTDPNGGSASAASLTGAEFGLYLGARYWFSDHIGAWLELQYGDASFDGVSINASNIGNLGVSFKF